MRHVAIRTAALVSLLVTCPSLRLAAQKTSSPISKLADLDTTDIWGIAEPRSGRFVVFGGSSGIKVLDRRTRTVTRILDSTAATMTSWFGGSLSLSATS